MNILGVYWRGDEYDLSNWQGWVMLAIGLILWSLVSSRGKKPESSTQKQENSSDEQA